MKERRSYRPKDRYLKLIKTFEDKARKANFDSLTGLYNKNFLQQLGQINQSRRLEDWSPYGIAFIDVDNFKKSANDIYGHQIGDQILKLVANVIHETVRESDIPARWGGDEFVVLMPDVNPDLNSEDMENIIRERMSDVFQSKIKDLLPSKPLLSEIGFSVGFVMSEREQVFDSVVTEADVRMYMNKNKRNRSR